MLQFLGLLWTQHSNPHAKDLGVTMVTQARALKLGQVHLQSLKSTELQHSQLTQGMCKSSLHVYNNYGQLPIKIGNKILVVHCMLRSSFYLWKGGFIYVFDYQKLQFH